MAPLLLHATTMRDDSPPAPPASPSVARGASAPRASVSIVIPVFNRMELTQRCLEAIAANTGGTFEVVVVDNASTDGTSGLLARFGAALTVVRHEENLGFARACNAGARVATGDHLVFLNNDTLPQPGWLDALTAAAAPDVGAVGARLLYPNGTIQHAGIAFTADGEPFHLHQGLPADAPIVLDDRDCEAVTGACLLVPRALFVAVGGFDEGYRMYFEDVDLCLKIRAAGRRVRYAARSVVVHLERASSGSFEEAFAQNRTSRERFRARWLAARPSGSDPVPPSSTSAATGAASRPARARLRVLFQARDSLTSHPGGDTVVVQRLMAGLAACGVDVRLGGAGESPAGHDLVHTLNFATPEVTRAIAERADAAGVPLVVTALYEDWPRFLRLAHATASTFTALCRDDGAAIDRAVLRAVLARVRELPSADGCGNRAVAGIARMVFASGESERRRLLADHPALREVRVIPFGADAARAGDEAAPGAFTAVHGVRDYVLCVARLEPRKNQLMLLEALRDDPRPVVLVGGGVTYAAAYGELCRRFRRGGPTLVLGRLPAPMLTAAFREAAVHCLPSWYELPGLVSLEAAAAGTRVVASSWGGLADYLGDTVEYCEPDDPASIARALAAAASRDPAPAAERARAFTWERTVAATLAAYEEVVDGAADGAVARPDHPEPTPAGREPAATPTAVAVSPPPGGERLLADAEAARRSGDFAEVLAATERALAAGADPGRVAALRAVALVRLRRFDEAREACTALLATAAHARRAAFGLGVIALERDDLVAADAWLLRATAGEADADAWATLGVCRARRAQAEDAWQAFATARALDPGHRTALHGLIMLATDSPRLAELERHLRDYLERVGDDPDVRYALAGCLYAAGRDAESRAVACEVLAGAPQHARAATLAEVLAGGGGATVF